VANRHSNRQRFFQEEANLKAHLFFPAFANSKISRLHPFSRSPHLKQTKKTAARPKKGERNELNLTIKTLGLGLASCAGGLLIAGHLFAAETMHKSGLFKGPKANTGFVTASMEGGKIVLALSNDFQNPDTPDPHWQVIDSQGAVYDPSEDRHQRQQDEPQDYLARIHQRRHQSRHLVRLGGNQPGRSELRKTDHGELQLIWLTSHRPEAR
jgi:hypothetical protein